MVGVGSFNGGDIEVISGERLDNGIVKPKTPEDVAKRANAMRLAEERKRAIEATEEFAEEFASMSPEDKEKAMIRILGYNPSQRGNA